MPNYRRSARQSVPIFFTVCLAQRGSTVLIDHLDVLRQAVRVTQRDRPFDILACVVLPDDLHCVWQLPQDDPNYSQRWGRIKARFSRDARRAGESGIWQRRFWEHHCRDERDLQNHIRYCWLNPVKHGLVEKSTDWVPSSIHRDIRLGKVEPEWGGLEPDGHFGEIA